MKRTTKTTKLLSWVVMLTFCFLCMFNVTYSYFSTMSDIKSLGNMNNIDVSFVYISERTSTQVAAGDKLHLFLENESVGRGEVSGLKVSASNQSGYSAVSDIGFKVGTNSCPVYIRFWVEAYKAIQIAGSNYYIDSKGNYVDENGNYVDEQGNSKEVELANQGEIIDYGQYFEIGYLDDGEYNIHNSVEKKVTTYRENDYATYFYKNVLTTANPNAYLFNALKWLDTTPNDLLGASMSVFVSFQAVQQSGNAYLSCFDDYRGYYNW